MVLDKRFKWTKKQEDFLKKNYLRESKEMIMKFIPNKSWDTICAKGLKLGLKRQKFVNYYNSYKDTQDYNILLTKEEKAYIAGILDGEGCIYRCKDSQYRILIANTYKPLIDYLEIKLKIKPTIRKLKRKEYHKDCYYFTVMGILRIYSLLTALLPYLIVKEEKAKKAIEELSKRINMSEWQRIKYGY